MEKLMQTVFNEDGTTEDYIKVKEAQHDNIRYIVWENVEYKEE